MLLQKKITFFLILSLISCGAFLSAETSKMIVSEVAENIYCIRGMKWDVSSVFIVADKSVIVVDAGNSIKEAEEIQNIIKSKTNKPIKHVVLTHYHADHTSGLAGFPSGIEIIAHENCNESIVKDAERNTLYAEKVIPEAIRKTEADISGKSRDSKEYKELQKKIAYLKSQKLRLQNIKTVKPNSVFKDKKVLFAGDKRVEIIYPGETHTDGSIYLYVPSAKLLLMGDIIFNKYHPFIDWRKNSDTAGWIKLLKKLHSMDIDKVVAGHGEYGNKDLLIQQAEYLSNLSKIVKDGIAEGKSVKELKGSTKMEKYSDYGFKKYFPQTVESLYMEMTKK